MSDSRWSLSVSPWPEQLVQWYERCNKYVRVPNGRLRSLSRPLSLPLPRQPLPDPRTPHLARHFDRHLLLLTRRRTALRVVRDERDAPDIQRRKRARCAEFVDCDAGA